MKSQIRFISFFFTAAIFMSFCMSLFTVNRYHGFGNARTATEYIQYTRKEEYTVQNSTGLPDFYSGLTDGCASAAGTVVAGYFDKNCPDLIPDWNTYYGGSQYIMPRVASVANTESTLYSLMKTNQGASGTSINNFKLGLQQYANSRGYNISYSNNLRNFFFFNLSEYQNQVRNQKPVVLFLNGYSYVPNRSFYSTGRQDTITVRKSSARHTAVGYGYKQIKYFRTETRLVWSPVWYNIFRFVTTTVEACFRTDQYLMASFGDGTLGYINYNTPIEAAFGVSIW